MEHLTIVIRSAEMSAIRKLDSSGPFPDNLRNPSVQFGGVSAEHFVMQFIRVTGMVAFQVTGTESRLPRDFSF